MIAIVQDDRYIAIVKDDRYIAIVQDDRYCTVKAVTRLQHHVGARVTGCKAPHETPFNSTVVDPIMRAFESNL